MSTVIVIEATVETIIVAFKNALEPFINVFMMSYKHWVHRKCSLYVFFVFLVHFPMLYDDKQCSLYSVFHINKGLLASLVRLCPVS